MFSTNYPRIVKREAGPGTCVGSGDILTDSNGDRWRIVDSAEISILRSGTAPTIIRKIIDGTIR